MTKIAIATCRKMPEFTPSDAVLAKTLETLGAEVTAAPWNDDFAPFASADLTVIRSTWDYFDVANEFAEWTNRLERETRVLNAAATLRWNMTKDYLFELAEKGAPVPPSRRISRDAASIAVAMDDLALEEAIVKPLSGGTASGLSRVRREDEAGLASAASILNGEAMVQPFLPEIVSRGETSLVFLGGAFSHAVLKKPKSGDIRVQTDHGGTAELNDAPDWAIDEAQRILALCPGETAYARVDVIIDEGAVILMEVELVEPELFFLHAPDAADRLADILLTSIEA